MTRSTRLAPNVPTASAESRPDDRPERTISTKRTVVLTAVLAILLLLALAIDWPSAMRFTWTAFEDRGGTLLVQSLLRKGMLPAIDFYYPYGLLPLVVAKWWFALFGSSPMAEILFMTACNGILVWGLARFALTMRLPRSGLLLLIVAAPLVIRPFYLNVTHALEAVLLVHALAEHARGRLQISLMLVTTCAFVKPTMAYVYGLILVLLLAAALVRQSTMSIAAWRNKFGPALITGIVLAAFLACLFGVRSLIAIQLPVGGRRAYALMNYGFFNGLGRNFWRPAGANVKYYLGTFAGVWLTMSALLLGGGVLTAVRRFRGAPERHGDELVLVALTLHLAFVCFFYGVAWDWGNYGFVLILGVLSMVRTGRRWAAVNAVLIGLMLLVHVQSFRDKLRRFGSLRPSQETANLWATASEREEWKRVLEATHGGHPLILKISGCAELLFPEFQGADEFYVLPPMLGFLPQAERERIRSALEQPRDIVVTEAVRPILEVEPFKQAVSNHAMLWRGDFFSVYRSR